jgi:hypothetical protein
MVRGAHGSLRTCLKESFKAKGLNSKQVRGGSRQGLESLVFLECTSHFFFYHCDKIPKKNNLEKERCILIHCVRDFSPWSAGHFTVGLSEAEHHDAEGVMGRAAHLMAARKQRARKVGGGRYALQTQPPGWWSGSSGRVPA